MSNHIDRLNEDEDRFGHNKPIFQFVLNEAQAMADEDIGRGVESLGDVVNLAATCWLCRIVIVSIDWSKTTELVEQSSAGQDGNTLLDKFEQAVGKCRENVACSGNELNREISVTSSMSLNNNNNENQ